MKKLVGLVSAVLITSAVIIGCTPQQKQAVARQLGMAAAVTWIGIDNPSTSDVASVQTVLAVIEDFCCTNCGDGPVSYYAKAYPMIDEYISEKVEPNQQPMARLGAAFILTSMDTAFAMNPSWNENASETTQIIEAFCQGAQNGLLLSPFDPIVVAAKRQTAVRMKAGVIKR